MALYMNLIMFCVCLILGKSTFTALHVDTEDYIGDVLLGLSSMAPYWTNPHAAQVQSKRYL